MKIVNKKSLTNIVKLFPEVEYACAYGSGVFSQGASTNNTMIDFIFAVNNASDWHEQNMSMNPIHYSLPVRLLGYKHAARIQKWGGSVYYNTHVAMDNDINVKYGIIETNDLINDLNDWRYLYISGRLHKPVVPIIDRNHSIQKAKQHNLRHAMNVALLLLPTTSSFTRRELYTQICGISYLGDIRVGIWEHPRKVKNIVDHNVAKFHELYESSIDEAVDNGILKRLSESNLQHTSDSHERLWSTLPNTIKTRKRNVYALKRAIVRRVRQSSRLQTAKGFLTAGFFKSLSYIRSKYLKSRIN